MRKIRLLLADDHAIFRTGLRAVFSGQPDLTIVAEAADGDEALAQAQCSRADVLLMDMSMPGCSGRQLIQQVQRRAPMTKILVVSMHREEQYAAPMIRAGAKGFITKSRSPAELLEATRKVAAGGIFLSPELAQKIAIGTLDTSAPSELYERLSEREREVMRALAAGMGVSAIAEQFHLSPKTVSTHKTRIFQKLEIGNISDLVRYTLDRGLI